MFDKMGLWAGETHLLEFTKYKTLVDGICSMPSLLDLVRETDVIGEKQSLLNM